MSDSASIFVTATGTEVGKTVVSRLIVKALLDAGERVGYFKSVASGCEPSDWGYRSPDEIELIERTELSAEDVTASFRFEAPLSPDRAAQREDRTFDIEGILGEWNRFSAPYDRSVVEGIGGVAVPFNDGEDVADLMAAMELPGVVVVPGTLGTISYTRTAIHYMRDHGCDPRAIVLTPERGREIERINRDHLRSIYPDLSVSLVPDVHESGENRALTSINEVLKGSGLL